MSEQTLPPIITEAIAHKKFSCPVYGAAFFRVGPLLINPKGIGIVQPSVDAQRLRWVVVQTIHQL